MRLAVALLLGLLTAAPLAGAADGPVVPSRQQLTERLAGNSLRGIQAGRHYLQYFDTDGSTLYREQDGPLTEGRWRVDEGGIYCSLWPPAEEWECYGVLVSGTTIYWRADGQYYPADILPGKLF
jgi:hypothetical protein